jgi:tRNA threonylcarbamoyladenosine biosynthesis protein TsaB
MPVLGLDTSTRAQSVALASAGRIVARVEREIDVTHSETILEAVDHVLREGGVRPAGLDAIAVAAGPGSFTGLRIGMATAKGIALAAGIPLAGFSTLALLAARLLERLPGPDGLVVALVDAGRGQLYRAVHRPAAGEGAAGRGLVPLGAETVCAPEAALEGLPPEIPVVAGGDGALRHRARIVASRADVVVVDPTPYLAPRLALEAEALHRLSRLHERPPVPNYVRPPDALAGGPP